MTDLASIDSAVHRMDEFLTFLAGSESLPTALRQLSDIDVSLVNDSVRQQLRAVVVPLVALDPDVIRALRSIMPVMHEAVREAVEHSSIDRVREELLRVLGEVGTIDAAPSSTIRQIERAARRRRELVHEGAYTVTSLSEVLGVAEGTVRQRIRRWRDTFRVFTVTDETSRVLIPAFLLDEELEPHTANPRVLEPLVSAGFAGWELWAWLANSSNWLDGDRPSELLVGDPDRAAEAARQVAENAAA